MGSPNREGDRAGNALQPNPVYSPTESLAVTARRLAAVQDAGVPAIAPGAPSTRYPVQRYGDWFTGDDTELDRKLADYNLDVPEGSPAAQAQASRRAARRQSWLAKTRGLRPGDAALEPRERGAAGREHDAAGREHDAVARSLQSVTEQLCSQLDELVPAAEKSGDEAPGQPSLRQQLVASWNGKSYYERLASMADEPEQDGASDGPRKGGSAPSPAPARNSLIQPLPRLPTGPAAEDDQASKTAKPESNLTPGRARRLSTFNDLTEGLKALRVGAVNGGRAASRRASLTGLVRALTPSRMQPADRAQATPQKTPAKTPAELHVCKSAPEEGATAGEDPASVVARLEKQLADAEAQAGAAEEASRRALLAANASNTQLSAQAAQVAERFAALQGRAGALAKEASALEAAFEQGLADLTALQAQLSAAAAAKGPELDPGSRAGGSSIPRHSASLPPRKKGAVSSARAALGGWR
ncbi:hypothetical protein QBZ16_003770 [Prototheca wickerhamii]|uniref:Uncharacterized protein n=1 Tax=Prototheca wickerhamii TaxID=3111 RepID=A0AAD9IKJ1_PROWI|nr:hypothetical protein QBZ16_003770 [Prototheca wickerhamii]